VTPMEGKQRGRPKSDDPRTMVGAGIKASEKKALEEIAKAHGVALNTLVAFLLRHGLSQIKKGKLKLPVTEKKITTLQMPE